MKVDLIIYNKVFRKQNNQHIKDDQTYLQQRFSNYKNA